MTHKFEQPLVESAKFENPGDIVEGKIFIIDSTMIDDKMVPYLELLDKDDLPCQVLMSTFALHEVWNSPDLQEDGYLVLRYDGESKTIKKAQNNAKLFSVCYYAPGDWKRDKNGEIEGTPTRLKKGTNRKGEKQSWKNVPQDDDGLPFNPEDESQSASAAKPPKNAKKTSK